MNLPKQIVIETTSKCNLECRGCYREISKMDYPRKHMDNKLFISIISQISEWDPKPIIIPFSDGEPSINPSFADIIRHISYFGLHYNFATNGTIWNECIFKFALATADAVCFSLDGLYHQVQKYYRGIMIDHHKIVSLINKKRTCRIACSLTRNGQDWEEIEEFINVWLNEGIDYVIIRNYLNSNPYNGRPLSIYKCKYLNPNPHYFVIRSDGKVRLCERNMNAPIIGDLNKELFKDVLPRLIEHKVCETCGQRYCGSGMYGSVRFKSNPSQLIYFKQDYFNQIYSLKEVKKGVSWT